MSRSEGWSRRVAIALVVTLGAAGCSLLVDTGPYVGGGTDAGPDAALDAAVDPDAPTAPEVRILPAAPVTTDELMVEIVTESTDPLDAGPVTYEYRWLRDSTDSGESGTTVAATLTSRGELWRVEVTPVSADGSRRGAPGTAEVTIGNLPPSLGYLGLDHYRPIEGEVLQAFVGGVDDPDGDSTRVSYVWTVDDVELSGVTGPRLTLDAATAAVGTSIRVTATPDDMTDSGGSLSAGPAIVLSDDTRWRQLLPNRTFREGDGLVYDPVGRRVIVFDTIGPGIPLQVWEHALDDGPGEFIQIYPSGTPPPLTFASWVYDQRNRRILTFGGFDPGAGALSNELYSLDLTVRGSEAWSVVSTAGPSPDGRALPAFTYDPVNGRVIMFGGGALGGAGIDELWSLDVATVGFEAWTRHDTAATPGAIIAPSMVVDPTRDRAVMFGGALLSGGVAAAFDTIHTIALSDLDAGFADTGERLPRGVYVTTVGVDPAADRAIVAFGSTDAVTSSDGVWEVDLETLESTALDFGPSAPTNGGAGFLVADEYADRLIFFPGVPQLDRRRIYDLYAVSGSTLTPIHKYGVDAPRAVVGAVAGNGSRMRFFGGESHDGFSDGLWSFDPMRSRLTSSIGLDDEVTGQSPGPRGHAGWFAPSGAAGSDLTFFGGIREAGLADTVVWTLEERTVDTAQWIERTLGSGSPPAPRTGATQFNSSCLPAGYFGGSTSSGPSNETGHLTCTGTGGLRDCTWADPVTGTRPPAREGGAMATIGTGELALFGGAAGAVLGDLWIYESCAFPPAWTAATPTGTAPSARSHHSMNQRTDASAPTVLLFGGREARDGPNFDDTFELVEISAGSYDWRPVNVASGPNDALVFSRDGHVAWYDDRSIDRRLVVYGGSHEGTVMSDLWELRLR